MIKIFLLLFLVEVFASSFKKPKATKNSASSAVLTSAEPELLERAWDSANMIPGRDPSIWRLDINDEIIISPKYAKQSSMSFSAILNGRFGNKSIRNGTSAPLTLNDDYAAILDLIEIALFGYISGPVRIASGEEIIKPLCHVPSEIHHDIRARDLSAIKWVRDIYTRDAKYGLAGYITLFRETGPRLNDPSTIKNGKGSRPLPLITFSQTRMECSQYMENNENIRLMTKTAAENSDDSIENEVFLNTREPGQFDSPRSVSTSLDSLRSDSTMTRSESTISMFNTLGNFDALDFEENRFGSIPEGEFTTVSNQKKGSKKRVVISQHIKRDKENVTPISFTNKGFQSISPKSSQKSSSPLNNGGTNVKKSTGQTR